MVREMVVDMQFHGVIYIPREANIAIQLNFRYETSAGCPRPFTATAIFVLPIDLFLQEEELEAAARVDAQADAVAAFFIAPDCYLLPRVPSFQATLWLPLADHPSERRTCSV